MRLRRGVILVVILSRAGAIVASGCKKEQSAETAKVKDTGITRTALRGPVKLTVQTDRSTATIAERFKVTITVEAEDGVDVEMPHFGESLGAFAIRDFHETSARPIEGGKRRWTQQYEIDCDLSGKYKVDPITAKFVDRRKEALQRAHPTTTATSQPGLHNQVTADAFELEVTSLLEGQFDPQKFRDVKGPVDLPTPPSRWYWWALGGGAAAIVLIVLVVWLVRRRRRRGPRFVEVPPHEWAMAELQRLVDEDLLGKGRVQEFYYRLNGIIRQYIEHRFGLTAPEMTTEEFLAALRDSDHLSPGHKELLKRFMAACDLVKYARYLPGSEEVEQVFATARDFIVQTTDRGKAIVPAADEEEMQESAA
ncbi:MAG: DUF4381 family protein [Phycisphaerae bacterium]|nr:DUF4381 family protein [Phycisphaerae bacterium]